MNESIHKSVLAKEVSEYLAPAPSGRYLDATFGGGGHSRLILEASKPSGEVVALDRDESVREFALSLTKEFGKRFRLLIQPYDQLDELDGQFDGILFDLGLSSDQLAEFGRGFSFQRDEPLDMRFDRSCGQSAAQFLAQSGLREIERVLREYAEDRKWRQLAGRIVVSRREKPIRTTNDLIKLVGTDHPAVLAPIFQGLRIQVNDELNLLKRGLTASQSKLKVGGRLVVISFHSLEDAIVKAFFRTPAWQVLTKKPVRASEQEQNINPRSRSAKLRAAIKIN